MIRPVLGTIAARVLITGSNLLLVVMTGHALGSEGLGTVSLVVLGVTIILLFNHIVGGGGLVYLVPRHAIRRLLAPSYGWAFLIAGCAYLFQQFVPLVPVHLVPHIVLLALLQSLNSIHLNVLLGRERIGLHNMILVGQVMLQMAAFGVLLNTGDRSIMDYVEGTYIAHGATVLVSALFALRHLDAHPTKDGHAALPALFRQGGLAQMANLLQLLNYRLGFYLIEHMRGMGALGIYSTTTQLAESAWLVPKSIGGVLYSKMSNMVEAERQRSLTVVLLKASLVVGAASCAGLLVVPEALYSWTFGKEIHGIHPILSRMVPGLLAMSASQVLSHYFSGTGRIAHNTIASGLGLLVTIPASVLLIPRFGLEGAALAASLAYTTSVVYQFVQFMRITGTRGAELIPHAGDRERLVQLWSRLVAR